MTDKELEHIYNEAYRPVYWTAYSFLKNDQDAEDVVQDTFISFITSYGDLKDTSKAVALLKKIAANKCLDRIKLTKTDAVEDEFFENIEAVPEDFLPESIIESEQMRKIVMDIIGKTLSEDIRRTLILFYFNELTTREIADLLGIPQGTVLWRLNFAKKKIKKEVEKYEEENDTKLFMAVPFLTKLFIKEAEQVAFKPMPASLTNYLSASTKTFATEAAKKGAGIMSKKVIGIIAASAAVTAVAAGIVVFVNSSKSNPGSAQESNSIVSYESVAEQGAEETAPTLYPQDYLIPDVSMVFDGMTRDEVKTNLINILTVSQYTFGEGYGRRFGVESPDIHYSSDFDYTWPDGTFDADACIYSIIAFLDIEDIITGTHGDMGDVILVVHCTDEAMAQMITEVGREIQEEYHLDPGYPQDSDYSLTEDGIYHCIMNLPIIVNE